MKKHLFLIGITMALLGLIFCFSAQSNSAEITARFFGPYNFIARKSAHMLEHAVLFTALYWTALTIRSRRASSLQLPTKLLLCLISLVLTINFAILDEWHQSFVPGRTSCVADVLWDSGGAAAACLLQISRLCYRNCKQVTSCKRKSQ